MGLIQGITVRSLESIKGGMSQFYTPQASNETMLVQIPANSVDDLFCHKYQTDQLLVVRGSFILVILQQRQYSYIPLSEHNPQVVTIPPGVPHTSINPNSEDCLLVNAVLRHGAYHERDYRPVKPPFPYDLSGAIATLQQLETPSPEICRLG